MRAAVFWIGFALIFSSLFTGLTNLVDLLMRNGPRKQFVQQLGIGAAIAGGMRVLFAWLA